MADNSDTTGKDALVRARAAGLTPNAAMDAKAADILRTAIQAQTPPADLSAAKLRALAVHAGCFLLLAIALWLKFTVLKAAAPILVLGSNVDPGTFIVMAAVSVWTAYGAPSSTAVLAVKLAKLEPDKLQQMLSLRPPAAGNALSVAPPPLPSPTAADTVVTPIKPPPVPPPSGDA